MHAFRRELKSLWRRCCFKQALLWWLVCGRMRWVGFGVSMTTAWRCVDEALGILACWAPSLHEVLVGLGEDDFVIVDGTLVPTDLRGRAALQPKAQAARDECAGHRPPGRHTPVVLPRAAGTNHDLTAARAPASSRLD